MNAPTISHEAGFSANGYRKTGLNSTIQITESHANGRLQRPRLQVWRSRHDWSPRMPSQMHDAVGPVQEHRAHRGDAADEEQRIAAEQLGQDVDEEDRAASSAVLIAMTALLGVRQRLLTFLSQPLPGSPSSRLNANSIRPAEAIEEKPQNVIAKATPAARRPPSELRPAPRLDSRMYCDAAAAAAVGEHVRRATSSSASARRGRCSPTTAETATDRKTPQADARRAKTVSSATWAEAS